MEAPAYEVVCCGLTQLKEIAVLFVCLDRSPMDRLWHKKTTMWNKKLYRSYIGPGLTYTGSTHT